MGASSSSAYACVQQRHPAPPDQTRASPTHRHVRSTVFKGTVNWPNVPKGTGPAPWTHTMKCSTPFLYVKAAHQSLIVDVLITATTYANSTYTIAASAPASKDARSGFFGISFPSWAMQTRDVKRNINPINPIGMKRNGFLIMSRPLWIGGMLLFLKR